MKYTGQFRDVNEKLYTLDIITENNELITKEIEFSDTPIITEVESDKTIFKPVKYSSATINLLVSNIIPDIYSSKAQGTKVILSDDTGIKWVGYVTPNIYNQEFNYEIEELEIDAIDGLSTLQYIDYDSTYMQFNSFAQIIQKILSKCNCYNYFYYPASIQEKGSKNEDIFRNLWVSEANFFDEDGEPMKCDEVLEEICKFMGVTCIAEGDSVYFLDYESMLPNNNNYRIKEYYKVNCSDSMCTEELVSLAHFKRIEQHFYSASNTQITLGDTFNKIKVKDSLYSVETVLPDIEDKKLLKNRNKDDFYEQRLITYPLLDDIKYNAFYKFYNHESFKNYYYYKSKDGLVLDNNAIVNNSYKLSDYVGATIMKVYCQEEEEDNAKITSLDWKTYIYVHNNNLQDGKIRPVLKTQLDKELALNNNNTYIILDGLVNFCRENHLPITEGEYKNDAFEVGDLYIEAILRYGDLYFDGRSWNKTRVPFKINLDCTAKDANKHLFNKDWSFKSNIDYTMNLEETKGLAIKLPTNVLSTEAPELTLIQPRQGIAIVNKEGYGCNYTGYWLSNFEMKVEIANFNSDDKYEEDTDTSYENIIDEDYVNDFKDEEFKICTWDNKKSNYSAVIYNNGTELHYLDKLYNRATLDNDRAEVLFINRMLRQYSKPPLILNISTYNNLHCYSIIDTTLFSKEPKFFIIDSQSINWMLNTNNVKLNEINYDNNK